MPKQISKILLFSIIFLYLSTNPILSVEPITVLTSLKTLGDTFLGWGSEVKGYMKDAADISSVLSEWSLIQKDMNRDIKDIYGYFKHFNNNKDTYDAGQDLLNDITPYTVKKANRDSAFVSKISSKYLGSDLYKEGQSGLYELLFGSSVENSEIIIEEQTKANIKKNQESLIEINNLDQKQREEKLLKQNQTLINIQLMNQNWLEQLAKDSKLSSDINISSQLQKRKSEILAQQISTSLLEDKWLSKFLRKYLR